MHAKNKFDADPSLIDPDIRGLDATFDRVISDIPDALIRAPDDFALEPEWSADPLGKLKDIRDRCGYVVKQEEGKFGGVTVPNNFGVAESIPQVIVLGAEEQDLINKDVENFQNEGAYGMLGAAQGVAHGERKGTIPTIEDGDAHDFLRDFYDTFLNQNTMALRSKRLIRPVGEWLFDRMELRFKRGEDVCLVRDLALPLTYKAMSTMLGVPQDQLPKFVELGEKLFSAGVNPDQGAQAGDQLYDFFLNEVQKRKSDPKSDVITYLVQAKHHEDRVLNDEEAAISARFILPAGIETTWRGLSLMLFSLLAHPDQYDDVCQDPKLARRAVEEGLRYAPSGFVVPRLASKDIEIAGCGIPAGAHITTFQGVCNRDPRRWENPDVFDIHRKFLMSRTFNVGIHACAGQHLARLEMLTCLEMLVERLPNIKLAVEPEEVQIRGLSVRSPLHVPLRLV